MTTKTTTAIVLLLSAAAAAGEPVADGVAITVDGTKHRAEVVSLDGGPDVLPDDLIAVREFLLPRGTEPVLTFRSEPGLLWQTFADGRERVVGAVAAALRPGETPDDDVRVGGTTYGGVKPRRDTIGGLGDADVAGLRAVVVVNWSDTIAAQVAKVDASRACFVVSVCEEDPIPPLPAAARAVVLTGYPHDRESVPSGLAPLARLTDLRFLKLGWHFGDTTDLTPLAGLKGLRRLALDFREVEHPEVLAKLTSLRVLDAAGVENLTDAAFLRPLAHLVRVDVSGTPVADLSPLSDHAELREIAADLTKVRVLPNGALPALREFRLLSAPVPREEVDAFAKAHPQCEVVFGWGGLFVKASAKADRVRIRSGGTCHRDRSEETTLLELSAREDIDEFVRLLRFEDSASGGACACCGSPTFEFYEGTKLSISLGYHHGRTLRWPGGPWPGDALLVPAASAALCEWLAKRGVTGPKEEIEEEAQRRAELVARDAEQDELLGKERIASIHAAADVPAAAKLFAAWFPDREARLALLLRLASRPTRSGNVEPRDRVVAQAEWVLEGEEEPSAVLAFLAARIAAGGDDARYAADVVDSLREDRFDAAALETVRLAAARLLLAAQESYRAVRILEDAKSKTGDELLLSLLPAADERGEPRGAVTSLHVDVVFVLAERCDASLLPRLRAIAVQAPRSSGYGNAVERFDRIVSKRAPKEAAK